VGVVTTRQYARLLSEWIAGIGLDPSLFGTHSIRRTKATLFPRKTSMPPRAARTLENSRLRGIADERRFTVDPANRPVVTQAV
jgi:hypothetical protein